MPRSTDDILDELSLLRFRSGEIEAMDEVVERWHPKLLRHAYRLTQRAESAADIVQDSWLAIVRGVHRLDDPAAFPAWAYRIVTNKCADWVRRQQRRRTTETVSPETASLHTDAQKLSDEGDELRQAIRRLPVDQRVVISMFYLEEQSTIQIADALEIPVGTVKSRLHTAREQLKQILERTNNDES